MREVKRTLDIAGRMVLPVDFRKRLALSVNDDVTVSLDGDAIIIRPAIKKCRLCGGKEGIHSALPICHSCIFTVKSLS